MDQKQKPAKSKDGAPDERQQNAGGRSEPNPRKASDSQEHKPRPHDDSVTYQPESGQPGTSR